jgi:hypothetical protein
MRYKKCKGSGSLSIPKDEGVFGIYHNCPVCDRTVEVTNKNYPDPRATRLHMDKRRSEASQKPQDRREDDTPRNNPEDLSPESLYHSKKYLSNCILRIMRSPCKPYNETRRSEDLVGALYRAAALGVNIAHRYLIRLCDEAEAGKYNE